MAAEPDQQRARASNALREAVGNAAVATPGIWLSPGEHLRILREHTNRRSLDDALVRDAVSHRLEVAIDAIAKVSDQFPHAEAPKTGRISLPCATTRRGHGRADPRPETVGFSCRSE